MSSRPRVLNLADLSLCALVCLAGSAVTALVVILFIGSEQRTEGVAFQLEVDERFSRLQRRFMVQDLKLETVKRFFINADDVTEKEFLGFVTPLVENGESYGWVPRILDDDLERFRAKALLNGTSDFSYHEIDSVTGAKRPLTRRPEHSVLLYLVKRDDVKITPGLDVSSRPGRQVLLDRARATHQRVVSEPLKMTNGQSGVYFVAPVFQENPDVSLKDDGLQGYVIATVRLAYLMEQSIPLSSLQRLNVTLFTTEAGEEIYQSSTPAAASLLYAQKLLKVADRTYLMEFRPSAAFLTANDHALSSGLIILFGAGFTLLMMLLVYVLITQRTRALSMVEERTNDLQILNITDHLTGVFNRRHFEDSMERLLVEAQTQNRSISLIMFDIDHFKAINDRWGHHGGDAVLKSLCTRVGLTTRTSDLLCRTGGEEFALICPYTDLSDASGLAEKLRVLISNAPFGEIGRVTCSFGVAQWEPQESFDALVQRVDAAMYEAKAGGRNRVQPANSWTPER